MTKPLTTAVSATALDYDSTIVAVVELSGKSWVVGAQVPGVARQPRHSIKTRWEDLVALLDRLRRRAAAAGKRVDRVVLAYEAGRDGFWLARLLAKRGIEVYVMQPSSIPVDRRARRAKTDLLDVAMLLRTLLAWLRGEPRVCSMVPVPSVAEEDGRRPTRERQDLIRERLALTNKIDGLLATFGIPGYQPLRRDRRARLEDLRRPEGELLPANAKGRLIRILDQLELVMGQIKELEKARNAVVTTKTAANEAEAMIQQLAQLRAIGPELATLLVWEAYVRSFRNGKALGSYAGLTGTPFRSGGMDREQGISKDGNRRLRAAMVELAWLWLRWQPGSKLSEWFRDRTREAGVRIRKVAIVALARKLLVALWRYCREGLIPEGAVLKPTAPPAGARAA